MKKNPVTWVPSLYFAMGLPFVVLNMVSVLMFSGLKISDAQVAFWTSLVMLPWTLKPLWSPFTGMFKTKKFFVILTQILSGIVFFLIALSLHLPHFFAFAVALLFIIAFSGATHDIVADGVYMSVLSKSDQAKYIGWQGAFYNLAKIAATGGLVYFAGYLIERWGSVNAWASVMNICGITLLLLGFYHIRALPSGEETDKKAASLREVTAELWDVIKTFFAKKHIVLFISFILLYRFAEGFVIKIVPLFLKAPVSSNGLGLNEQQIGLYYGTFGALAFILGSLLSGYYVSSRGLKKTLFSLCCAFNIPFSVYLLLALFQPSEPWLIAGGIVFEYFGYGFGYVGLTLFMMQRIAPGKYPMAHYAFATGIMNLGVMLPGMLSGFVSDWLGYKSFFIFVMIATIPSFVITRLVNKKNEE